VGETEQFFSAAEKLKTAGVVPLAMGDGGLWATAELFENTLLGVLSQLLTIQSKAETRHSFCRGLWQLEVD
jgi:hypothetical protein